MKRGALRITLPKVLAFPARERERAIRALFPDAKPAGNGHYRARCTAHDDRNPSLSLGYSEDGRRVLVKCFAGCSHDNIAKGAGLRNATALYVALGGRPTESQSVPDSELLKHRSHRYHYRDERCRLLYDVQRYDYRGDKTFRSFQPDGTPGLNGVRRVVFRLDKLRKGPGKHAWWVEGEKKGMVLVKAGLAATTSAGGASGYKDEYQYPRQLKDAGITSVTVLPDNNDVGRRYADQVAHSLHENGLRVKLLHLPNLPQGKDIADWIAAGHTVRELRRLRGEAPWYEPRSSSSVVCLADVEPEAVEWVWRPYVPLGKVTLIEGDPGIGKSWLTLNIATAIAQGHGLPGMEKQKPRRVLLLTAEDGLGDTVRPRLNKMRANVQRIFALKSSIVFDEAGLGELNTAIRQFRPRVIIVDPFVAYLGANVDMHRANETRAVMAKLSDLAALNQCAIVLVRHLTKSGKDKSIYRGLGSIDLTAACRSVLLVGVDPEDDGCAALVHIKSNLAKKGPSQGYSVENGRFEWTGVSSLTAPQLLAVERDTHDAVEEACDFLRTTLMDGPTHSSKLKKSAQHAGISWAAVKRAKRKLSVTVERERDEKKQFTGFRWRLLGDRRANGANGQPEPTE